MNTTTGVINMKHKMNVIHKFIIGALLLFFSGCKIQNSEDKSIIKPRSDVMVTHPVIKDAEFIEEFQGITRYIQTIEIRAHVTGIISKVNVSLADKILSKQPLFEIRPRETSLLESAHFSNEFIRSAADTVFAYSPGIVNHINVQPGDFVQEGDLLASCVDQHSLRVVVSVPLEMDIAKIENQSCSILFPDGKILPGIVGARLPSANETDQTNAFLVKPQKDFSVPENIHVKLIVKTGNVEEGVFLPLAAIYGNEEQSQFWIIKICNDSIAVRIPVEKGIKVDSLVQVLGKGVSISDRFVCKGGYALSDSALVNIITPD
jgi:hypothetical protein